ncbi:glycosyltransferase family 4 protein [Microvirga sp. W0021]|uniref:Glycosyltransferase family 4 protein n=1 Tax=Hohaiivirga grylli TaxID=3133970 RepID=A0ABV0BH21_9HYPH
MTDIAFYAPMKSPDHPVPSGDRTMAQLLLSALQTTGFQTNIVSKLRSFEPSGTPARQAELKELAIREAEDLVAAFHKSGNIPSLWFSYHVYYKSPDWIGPHVARALNIPYVIAEGSRASKRANGPWALAHQGAEEALDQADIIFALTRRDSLSLTEHKPAHQQVLYLPPFLDLSVWPKEPKTRAFTTDKPAQLLTVAMMRKGDKLASYQQLAHTLQKVSFPWQLDVVGDGPAHYDVHNLFAQFGSRIHWHGEIEDKATLASLYSTSDLMVWPALNEAYGMVFLEAQAFGCPIVAFNNGGVADAVLNEETGILVSGDNIDDFASIITSLIGNPDKRQTLSQNAREFIRRERTLEQTAQLLKTALTPLIGAAR